MAGTSLAGAVGPLAGPRFIQFFRNVSKDFGCLVERGLRGAGLLSDQLDPRVRNSLGTLPSSFIKEGATGFLYSDGSLWGLAAGAGLTAVQQVAVFLSSRVGSPDSAGQG